MKFYAVFLFFQAFNGFGAFSGAESEKRTINNIYIKHEILMLF